MNGIADFIERRLAEDEAVAKATVEPHRWHGEHLALHGRLLAADEAHIARHDPARVLREVTAKRAILAELGSRQGDSGWDAAMEFAAGALASVYSDHPDFDVRWKP